MRKITVHFKKKINHVTAAFVLSKQTKRYFDFPDSLGAHTHLTQQHLFESIRETLLYTFSSDSSNLYPPRLSKLCRPL